MIPFYSMAGLPAIIVAAAISLIAFAVAAAKALHRKRGAYELLG
jgi:hypothetical protein